MSNDPPTILVVEDDPDLQSNLVEGLTEGAGYNVVVAGSLEEAREKLARNLIQLILLDVALPDGNGYTLFREVREKGLKVPVIMLTARGTLEDKRHGFAEGAADYLRKPCEMEEVLVHVGARLRSAASPMMGFAGFQIDEAGRKVLAPDKTEVVLSSSQFNLLCLLTRNKGKMVTREELMTGVQPGARLGDDTLNNLVSQVRRALKAKSETGYSIENVRSLGYLLDVNGP